MEAIKEEKITQKEIDKVVKRLAKTYQPETEMIYLFGSYAWGEPNEDSDLDLLIIVNRSDKKKYKRSIKGYSSLWDIDIAVDIIVYTKKEYEKLLDDEYSFCSYIVKNGRKVYES
ncbi:nucleotidyltransferase domain-containing protein [Natroniella acetigena]|uniref:nucleotidyltransferase domain-containing protein n=1 Tax=Natroniella acetigena TaxID=52004 RepID=UPI00200B293D|nr:nucleotidyltransferase domain-containing protein [Natroniella acetigena]MCK8826571.1 nucleotidyltransferase domain-containing protein [Natroniella acetigena]